MNFLIVIIKSIVSIIILFFLTKLMGRKQISQLSMYDYIIGITIGSVVAEISTNLEADFILGIIVMTTFTIISMIITKITSKNIIFRRFIKGVPTILIEDGKIIKEGLKKSKIDINDLLQEARINNYFDISKINYALMEANGKISFLVKSKYNNVTPSDLKLKVNEEDLCINLLLDGKILNNNLKIIKKDETWLLKRLVKQGYPNYNDLLLVTINNKEQLSIYTKNANSKKNGALE